MKVTQQYDGLVFMDGNIGSFNKPINKPKKVRFVAKLVTKILSWRIR